MVRADHEDVVYKTEREKFTAVMAELLECNEKGQPVLVGTTSVEKSNAIANLLKKRKIPHAVLNAKHHEREAFVIAQAGRKGAITVSTNMAGRGTDILLGGNPEMIAKLEFREQGRDPDKDPKRSPRLVEKYARPLQGRGRGGPRSWAGCTSSAPSATSHAASTTSCAAARAGRATPARAGSTCRSRTT